MMVRRKRHARMDPIRKYLKKAASYIGSGVIIAGASHGVISTVVNVQQGMAPSQIPGNLVFNYTGFDPATGHINYQQTALSLLTIGGAILAGKLIKMAGRGV